MILTCRFRCLIGFTALLLTDALHAGQATPDNSFRFVLQKNQACESTYATDDASTQKIEEVCADFDLHGLEASAFQSGLALGEVGNTGVFRPYWPLVRIVFNLDPRPLPDPAVSPLIFFRFVRDDLCSMGYAGELLDHPNSERGCLIFNLNGYQGRATREESFFAEGNAAWTLSNLQFDVPAFVAER